MKFAHCISTVFAIIFFIALAGFSLRALSNQAPELSQTVAQKREALYLPSGKGLAVLSFGYTNALSDALWFNTINYFGKHHRGDQNYRWLAHMCNLVTDLNPRALHVYDFCSTMLAWEVNAPREAVALLSKAISRYPDRWSLYYQRGFVNMFFLKDLETAKSDFLSASKLPDAHPLVKRLAAKRLVASDNAQTAIEFLTDMLNNEKDPAAHAALESRLREAHHELNFQTLERGRDIFKQRNNIFPNTLQELVTTGILQSEFKDPFGGMYVINPQSGEITSTSGHKRISTYQQ